MDRNDYEERRAIQEQPSNYASACPPNSFVTQYVCIMRSSALMLHLKRTN